MRPLRRAALLLACALVHALVSGGCRLAPKTSLIPVGVRGTADLGALHERFDVPLVVVRDIVYVPCAECVPLASEDVRERLTALEEEAPAVQDERVIDVYCHALEGDLPRFFVRNVGLLRVRCYRGERLLIVRDGTIHYEEGAEP